MPAVEVLGTVLRHDVRDAGEQPALRLTLDRFSHRTRGRDVTPASRDGGEQHLAAHASASAATLRRMPSCHDTNGR